MRLCRFCYEEEMILAGFYADDHVIPVDLAVEAYIEAGGGELPVPATENLMDLLPPDGACAEAMRELAAWVEGLDETKWSHLAIPLGEVKLLVPIARPEKI